MAVMAASIMPLAAQAMCWSGGTTAIQRLQASVDRSPREGLAAIDAAMRALELKGRQSSAEMRWLLATRTAALVGLQRYDEAEAAARQGLRHVEDDPVLQTEMLSQYVTVAFAKPASEQQALLDRLSTLRRRLPPGSAAAVCATNAMSILQRGLRDVEDALRSGGDAYRAAKAAGREAQAAYVALNLAALILSSGDAEQADDLAREAETWAAEKGFTFHQALAAFMRAQVAGRQNLERAAAKYLEAGRLARQLGVPSGSADQGACQALLSLRRLGAAEAACRRAERDLEPSDIVARTLTGGLLGDIELARGRLKQAIARYNDLLATAKAPALAAVADRIRQARAKAYAQLGDFAAAYADLRTVNDHIAGRTDAQRARDLANLRARFGWDRQRIANAELERDLATAAAREETRRLWLWSIGGWAALLAAMLGWVVITGRRHRRKLEQLADDARALARTKADLLANMSHEIRSPLGSLTLAAARLAASPDIPADGRQRAERLERAGERLMRLIEDLLLFSRIDAHQLPVSARPFDPATLIRDTAALAEANAHAAGVRIALSIDPAAPPSVIGDRDRLGQILTNLIDNAVKHAGATTITVSLAAAPGDRFRITVADDGRGIPAERRNLLFQRFAQIDGSGASRDGSGLGLAICRGLAELLGGEITIEDTQQGLRISVALPVVAEQPVSAVGLATAA